MTPAESSFRARAGVPPAAKYVLIFDSSAHLDYDWVATFPTYYDQGAEWSYTPVKNIYPAALAQMQQNTSYRYSVCEMDYFRSYFDDNPGDVKAFAALAGQLALSGGGLTSPDNLLSHGEAFLRNYLVGRLWLEQTLPELLPIRHAFLPDDFGHDPELPATLQALGVVATAFERVPGNATVAPVPGLMTTMFQQGIDFIWQASDGSSTLAHFLQGGYGQGSGAPAYAPVPPTIADIQSYIASYTLNGQSGLRTPYLYVPAANDFSMPTPNLVAALDAWNAASDGYAATGVWAVSGTLADFVQLLSQQANLLETIAWDGRPYWTGHYMSRADLKILHYGTARTLLAAESIGLMAAPGGGLAATFAADVLQAWDDFSPSTHHDFVNGTALDSVYLGEQLPMLEAASTSAQGLAGTALTALAGAIDASPQSGETPLVIANSLGTPLTALVELPNTVIPAGVAGVRVGTAISPVQASADGGILFLAALPSVGYTTGYLTPQEPEPVGALQLTVAGTTYTFTNAALCARIDLAAPYYGGISSFFDANGTSVLGQGAVGNQVVVYRDKGDIYEFGYEYVAAQYSQYNVFRPLTPASVVAGPANVTENGALRITVEVPLSLTFSSGIAPFTCTLEYSLTVNEPFLRMAITGAAPSGSSVTVAFPFAPAIDGLVNGTPNHWTASQQRTIPGWGDTVFVPTHRFVLPQSSGKTLAALYHPEVPAWAFNGQGLVGCVLRNTPGGPHGASGSDDTAHTLHYALRPALGLDGPAAGMPLKEALAYASPPLAALVSASSSQQLPPSGSVAVVTAGPGVILAAKPGDVAAGTTVLRLYQPTNAAQNLTVQLAQAPQAVIAVTALEDPIASGGPAITLTGSSFTIAMPNALATVQITW